MVLGAFWLHEGVVKYRAGFGVADIGLIVSGAESNTRIPGYFAWFGRTILDPLDGVFAVATPAVETVLGVALILGVLTLPAAVAGLGLLFTYWSADQLIDQYPVMAALSVVVILVPAAASRYSAPTAVRWWRRRRTG